MKLIGALCCLVITTFLGLHCFDNAPHQHLVYLFRGWLAVTTLVQDANEPVNRSGGAVSQVALHHVLISWFTAQGLEVAALNGRMVRNVGDGGNAHGYNWGKCQDLDGKWRTVILRLTAVSLLTRGSIIGRIGITVRDGHGRTKTKAIITWPMTPWVDSTTKRQLIQLHRLCWSSVTQHGHELNHQHRHIA